MLFVKENRIKAAACFLIQILTGALWFIWDFFFPATVWCCPLTTFHTFVLTVGYWHREVLIVFTKTPGMMTCTSPPCLYQLTCCTSLLKSSHESIFISRTSLSPLIVTYCILQGLNFLLFTHFQVCILESLLSLVVQVLQVGERSREKV